MRTNRELAFAVKRALATGTIALCGAGAVAAFAQPTTPAQATPTQATTAQPTAAKATASKTNTKKRTAKAAAAKTATAKAPILLAQATPPATNIGGPAAPEQLQTVVVTGSLIARTSIETPNPVQVISNKDLVQSGYTDISSVLKNISANGASTLSQSFSFAFAAGGSGVSLRGL